MERSNTFGMRVSLTERQLMAVVAQRLERTESDTLRLLVREKARELGVLPRGSREDIHDERATT
jgi:hypothetical protein